MQGHTPTQSAQLSRLVRVRSRWNISVCFPTIRLQDSVHANSKFATFGRIQRVKQLTPTAPHLNAYARRHRLTSTTERRRCRWPRNSSLRITISAFRLPFLKPRESMTSGRNSEQSLLRFYSFKGDKIWQAKQNANASILEAPKPHPPAKFLQSVRPLTTPCQPQR